MARALVSLFLIALIGYGGWYGYQHYIAAPAAQQARGGGMGAMALPVEGATIQPENLAITLAATGTLAADAEALLRAENAGRIERIAFAEGTAVKAGQTLFEIDARTARANLQQVDANASIAAQNLARARALQGTGAISAQEFDTLVANERAASAARAAAAVALDKATVKAPFGGMVGLRRANVGDYVSPGQELVVISRADPVRIEFTVPEQQADLIATGQTINFTTEMSEGETHTGTIKAMEPVIAAGGRQLRVLAEAENPDGKLRPGSFVNINATVAEKAGALMVPEQALLPMGDAQLLMIVGADGAVSPRPVKLGLRQAGRVEVVEGLSPGETVVTAGHLKLQPGAKVQVIGQQPAPVSETPPDAASPMGNPQPEAPLADAQEAPAEESSKP